MSSQRSEDVVGVEDGGSSAGVPSCQVCQTTVGRIGNFYGGVTCDNCRTFFKYHMSKRSGTIATKACTNLNACQLTPGKGNCQQCRLAECLKIGMTYETKDVAREEPDVEAVVIAEGPIVRSRKQILGPNSFSYLRAAFIDSDNEPAISIEEHRVLMLEHEIVKCVETNGPDWNDVESHDESARLTKMASQLRLEAYAQYSNTVYLASDSALVVEKEGMNESEEDKDHVEHQTLATLPSINVDVDFDDSIISGHMRQSTSTPVTSTPSRSGKFVSVNDFFGNSINVESRPSNNEQYKHPSASTTQTNRMMSRRSVVPNVVFKTDANVGEEKTGEEESESI